MKNLLFSIILLVSLTSCKAVLKSYNQLKSPKLETESSIKKYLLKNKIDTSNVYVYKDLNSFAKASKMGLLVIPDIVFFNKEGNKVNYKEKGSNCNAHAGSFIAELSTFSNFPSDDTKKIDDFVKLIDNPKQTNFTSAEINVFINWTIYVGRLNKVKAFDWIKLIEIAKQKGININYYLLNCDFQKSWNLTSENQEALGIKKSKE
jgi:hypothetical protein